MAGDSTEPDSYKEILDGVTDVVHTVGILMENDYKKIVQANSVTDAISGAGTVFGQFLGMKDNGNPFKQDSRSKVTYEMMNRDTGKSLNHTNFPCLLVVIFANMSDSHFTGKGSGASSFYSIIRLCLCYRPISMH